MTKAVKSIYQKLNIKEQDLKQIQLKLRNEEVDIKNKKYFKLLYRSSVLDNEILILKQNIKKLRSLQRKQMFVSFSSRVKLVSTKIGAVIWVDAKNYIELLGKNIGDVILMQNTSFYVAGIV